MANTKAGDGAEPAPPRPEDFLSGAGEMGERIRVRQAEEALRQSEEKFRAFFHTAAVATAQLDLGGHFVDVNERLCQLTGYSREELLQMSPADLVHPEEAEQDARRLGAYLRAETPTYEVEKRYLRKDGQVVWVHVTAALVRDASGRPLRSAGMIEDITERKRAEEAARASQVFAQATIDALTAHVCVLDERGRILSVNRAWRNFARNNSAATDFLADGTNYLEVCESARGPEAGIAAEAAAGIRAVLRGERESFTLEYPCNSPHEERWFVMRVSRYPGESAARAVVTHDEITQRKKAEQAMLQSQQSLAEEVEALTKLHALARQLMSATQLEQVAQETLSVILDLVGTDMGTVEVYDPVAKRLRYVTAKGFEAREVGALPLAQGHNESTSARALATGQRVMVEDVHRDPEGAAYRTLADRLGYRAAQSTPLIVDGQVVGLLSTYFRQPRRLTPRELQLLDVAASSAGFLFERLRAEEALRASERRLVLALEGGQMGMWEWDRQTNQSVWNAKEYELLGLAPGDGNSSSALFFGHVHPEDAAGMEASLRQAQGSGQDWIHEFRIVRADGQVRWLKGAGRFLEAANGQTERMVGVNYDITEQKEAQAVLARGKKELEHLVVERTAKLEELVGELEHFSYSIIHDMRAPLRAMRGFAEMIAEDGAAGRTHDVKESLRRILTAAERMDALITDALSYSQSVRQELVLKPVEVGTLLRGMLESYPEFQPSRATIELRGEFPPVMGNLAGLTQCFSNLLGNAVKFGHPGQKPEIRVWAELRTDAEAATAMPDKEQQWVRIWVEDKGIGISKTFLPRVFDMFSRGHDSTQYEGTGIGLALVRKVVQRMGGRVGLESEEGKGSRFWVDLRLAD